MKTSNKLILLCCLYLAQGLPYGFFAQALPALMRKQGVSLKIIGLSTLLTFPWALKFLWAPLVDCYGYKRLGHRRSWILSMQFLTIIAMFSISCLNPQAGLMQIMAIFVVVNLLAATQDIATDGLAVTLLNSEERGIGNGIQVAGYRLGMIIGGGALLIVYPYFGWSNIFYVMALIMAITSIPILLFKEPQIAPQTQEKVHFFYAISNLFTRPGMKSWLTILFLYKFGDWFATSMVRPLLIDKGYKLEDIGWLFGTAGSLAGLLGAILGGFLVKYIGHFRSLIGFQLAQAISIMGYCAIVEGQPATATLYTICIVEHICSGMATAALFTIMMDFCRENTASTDYTIQACIVVLASGIAASFSGFSAEALGYLNHFIVAVLICFLAVAMAVMFIKKIIKT